MQLFIPYQIICKQCLKEGKEKEPNGNYVLGKCHYHLFGG